MALKFVAETHKYYLDGEEIPSVTTVLGPLYRGPKASAAVLKRAAVVGTAAHALTEADDRRWPDDPPVVPDLTYSRKIRNIGRRMAWLDWRRTTGFRPTSVEQRMASPRGFAGTIDRIGLLPTGEQAIVDIKTGRVSAYARLQLAAYAMMARENGLTGDTAPARYIVQIGESGRWRSHEFNEHVEDEKDWLAALRLYIRLFALSWEADVDRV